MKKICMFFRNLLGKKANLGEGGIAQKRNMLIQVFAKRSLLLFIAVLAIGYQPIPLAQAAIFTVDSTTDIVDVTPGDGECATTKGTCTLRAAIQEANALAGADTISLPADIFPLSITGADEDMATTGDLDITDDLTITGAGAVDTVIDGGGIDRIFDILGSTTVTITKVTAQNGNLEVAGAFGQPGGGIRNAGDLMLNEVILTDNTAGVGTGGGIVNVGTLNLTNVTISGNTAFIAGGLGNGGDVILTNVSITGNTASVGGAGINNEGTATLSNVTISGNTSGGFTTSGGGIANWGAATLSNVTINGNTGGGGGGIFIPYAAAPSPYTELKNTIVANNSGRNCSLTLHPIVSLGYNLDSDNTCSLTSPGDLVNIDPLLGPLQDNDGPTFTHALLEDSPAIDAGSPDCPPPATDQRGIPRPQGAACDIGAFEVYVLKITVSVDIKPGSCPNPLNVKSKGVLPVAVLGTEDFDVTNIDPETLRLTIDGDAEGVSPLRWSYEDVATPYEGELCGCHDLNGDGYLDLTLKFDTQELVDTLGLGEFAEGDIVPLTITGNLKEEYDGAPIMGEDCVWILGQE